MEVLVVYFDALIKFKCISVPFHLLDDFNKYCHKRGIVFYGGAFGLPGNYQYVYVEKIKRAIDEGLDEKYVESFYTN